MVNVLHRPLEFASCSLPSGGASDHRMRAAAAVLNACMMSLAVTCKTHTQTYDTQRQGQSKHTHTHSHTDTHTHARASTFSLGLGCARMAARAISRIFSRTPAHLLNFRFAGSGAAAGFDFDVLDPAKRKANTNGSIPIGHHSRAAGDFHVLSSGHERSSAAEGVKPPAVAISGAPSVSSSSPKSDVDTRSSSGDFTAQITASAIDSER